MRRIMLLVVVASVMTLMLAVGTAGAHSHQICTPGQGDPTLGQEPFHTEDPSNGAILNNPNVTQANYDTWDSTPYTTSCTLGLPRTTVRSRWCGLTWPPVPSSGKGGGTHLVAGRSSLAELRPLVLFTETSRIRYSGVAVKGKITFLEWAYEDDNVRVRDGADYYLIEGGKIVHHTVEQK